MKLGFGQIEGVLRDMHRVTPDKEASFRARLRYLQQRVDIGVPRGGVGRRSNFEPGHAFLFGLALEFEQFGMPPEHVAAVFVVLSNKLKGAVEASLRRSLLPDAPAMLLWFIPEALAESVGRRQHNLPWATMHCSEFSQIPPHLFGAQSRASRIAIINLSALIAELVDNLAGGGVSEKVAVKDALFAWATEGGFNDGLGK